MSEKLKAIEVAFARVTAAEMHVNVYELKKALGDCYHTIAGGGDDDAVAEPLARAAFAVRQVIGRAYRVSEQIGIKTHMMDETRDALVEQSSRLAQALELVLNNPSSEARAEAAAVLEAYLGSSQATPS